MLSQQMLFITCQHSIPSTEEILTEALEYNTVVSLHAKTNK